MIKHLFFTSIMCCTLVAMNPIIIHFPTEQVLKERLYAKGFHGFADMTPVCKILAEKSVDIRAMYMVVNHHITTYSEQFGVQTMTDLMQQREPYIIECLMTDNTKSLI